MYTRFKTQKSGIKLSLNTLANTTRARVALQTPNSSNQPTQNNSNLNTASPLTLSISSSASSPVNDHGKDFSQLFLNKLQFILTLKIKPNERQTN